MATGYGGTLSNMMNMMPFSGGQSSGNGTPPMYMAPNPATAPAAPQTQEQIFNQFHQANFANDPRFTNPQNVSMGWGQPVGGTPLSSAPPVRMGGGGGVINTNQSVGAVPIGPNQLQGSVFQRLMDLGRNPGNIAADPGYQFLKREQEEAGARTAAARRMRFAGKTMLDAQDRAAGLASTYYGQMMRDLMPTAQLDYTNISNNARAQAERLAAELFRADPYGNLRDRTTPFQDQRPGAQQWVQNMNERLKKTQNLMSQYNQLYGV